MSGAAKWEQLLERATVLLEVPAEGSRGSSLGTGFVLTEGIVATCAHVIADVGGELPSVIHGRLVGLGRDIALSADKEAFFRDPDSGLDLALLRVADVSDVADVVPVPLSPELRTGDEMHVFGHPAGLFRGGQHATISYQGDSRRDVADGAVALPRGFGVPVGPGFSGSPVVNVRTGAVCGMIATSDKSGSAHLVPASEILHRMADVQADRRWLAVLSDDQLAAGGWRYPAHWLREYLRAALTEATRPAGDGPGLLRAYVPQHLRTHPGYPDSESESRILRGDDARPAVFTATDDVLVLGEPGMGKSTLTRMAVAATSAPWLEDSDPGDLPDVPVRIHASALAAPGPLATQLAAAVDESVGRLLQVSPPTGAFGAAPVPGARWLVLVDGLNEISDAQRRDVITALRHHRNGPYRFVATSRPVSLGEFDELLWSPAIHVYELQPLSHRQAMHLVRAWLADLPAPDEAAHTFWTHAFQVAGELMSSPMMIMMLCRLFIGDPNRRLPSSQYEVYRRFVEIVRAQQYASAREGVIGHITAVIQPYGSAAVAAAERLPARIDELLPDIAHSSLREAQPRIRDLLVAGSTGLRPPGMNETNWSELVRDCALRNGVLVARGADLDFLHATIAEFLAAGRVAADPGQWAVELRRIFGDPRNPRVPDEDLAPADVFLLGSWHGAEPSLSTLLRRLLADNRGPRPLVPRFRGSRDNLASARDFQAAVFVSSLASSGIDLDLGVRHLAIVRLDELAAGAFLNDDGRVAVARSLAALGDERGFDQLAALSGDPAADPERRFWAAMAGNDLGDSRFRDHLAAFAADLDMPPTLRLAAAENLAAVGDADGADSLFEIAVNPDSAHDHRRRISAAETLGAIDDERYDRALGMLATETDISDDRRRWVLRRLRDLNSTQYPKALAAIIVNPVFHESGRLEAANALAELGGGTYADALAALAADPTFSPEYRITAAEELVSRNDPRGTGLLDALEAYPITSPDDDLGAASLLAMLGDPHGLDRLSKIASEGSSDYSLVAALRLAELGDRRGMDRLAEHALGTTLGSDRLVAAVALAKARDPRGIDLLELIAADGTISVDLRVTAAAAIGRIGEPGSPRHTGALAALADDESISPDHAIHVAATLGRLGDSRGLDRLCKLIADRGRDAPVRLRAAIAAGKLGVPRGADALTSIATDGTIPGDVRIAAANALSRLADPRATRALAALAADTDASPTARERAISALHRFGYAIPADKLFPALAADGLIDDTASHRAQQQLVEDLNLNPPPDLHLWIEAGEPRDVLPDRPD
jgi:HEAT repeat protein